MTQLVDFVDPVVLVSVVSCGGSPTTARADPGITVESKAWALWALNMTPEKLSLVFGDRSGTQQ